MLSDYLNQTAVYHCKTGTDDRGQPIYAESIMLPCRHQSKIQNILTKDGQVVQTQHVYYLTDYVAEGDMIDNKIVMAVLEWVDLGGEVIGHKAVV